MFAFAVYIEMTLYIERRRRRYARVSKPVYTIQAVSCKQTSNRLSNRVVQPVWQPAVYMIQPVVKPVVKRVWQPVECLYTWYNRLLNRFNNRSCIQTFNQLSNRFDNRLYRTNGALDNDATRLDILWVTCAKTLLGKLVAGLIYRITLVILLSLPASKPTRFTNSIP